jgi:uncharacterized membrane protein YozB (DUF420 family)
MPSLISVAEVVCLALSGGALAWALVLERRGEGGDEQWLVVAAWLALGFVALYLVKGFVAPTVRYPRAVSGRGAYLFLLATHALLTPVGLVAGAVALFHRWKGRRERFKAWLRVAAPAWLIAAATGVVSAGLLWWALG